MHVVVYASAEAASRALAGVIAAALTRQPAIVLGLPTGRTSIPLYRELVALHHARRADFRRATVFSLDEFVGLPARHPGRYAAFMRRHLYAHVNLRPSAIHVPDAAARDPGGAARRYERAIARAGGLDLIVLGIGTNGHIGFNEPAAALIAETHVATLRTASRRANAEPFGGDWRRVPARAISMGVGTMLRARQVVLIATGASKARSIGRALAGPVTTRVPASLLQLHPNAVVVLDRDAAAQLRR